MKIIGISTGHSRKDSGAIACNGTPEYSLNAQLTNEITALNNNKDWTWLRTDWQCEDMPYPRHLNWTIAYINNAKDKLTACIEIHHNSVYNRRVSGGQVIYWDDSVEGKLLSDFISFQLNFMPLMSMGGFKDYWRNKGRYQYGSRSIGTLRHVRRRLAFLAKTKIPAVIIEPGFISNVDDLNFCIKYRKKIAMAIKDGIDWYVKSKT